MTEMNAKPEAGRKGTRMLLPVALAASLGLATWLAPDGRCDTPARMPRPGPQVARSPDPARANAQCEGCHEDIAHEWRSSMHAQADTDPIYRRALAIEPLPFCRGCHAPEADARTDAPPSLSALGVGCVTCHLTGTDPNGETLATHGHGGSAPHAVRREAAFATPAACASCHEFDFPTHAEGQPPERMQSTSSEHAASDFRGASCASCHMPGVESRSGGSHRSHAFGASRDLTMLRAAVNVTAQRAGASRVTFALAPGRVGHAFPTGDLFRRVLVSVEVVDDDWIVWSEASRALQRSFEMRRVAPGFVARHMVEDSRVGIAEAKPIVLNLGEAARGRAVAWRVEYQRVEHPLGVDGSGTVIADSVVIAEGLLPATEVEP